MGLKVKTLNLQQQGQGQNITCTNCESSVALHTMQSITRCVASIITPVQRVGQ